MIYEPQDGPDGLPETKRCSKCGEAKALDAFSRDRRSRDGRQAYCRACFTARYRQRRAVGLCANCSAPAVEGVLCAEHRAAQAARDAVYYASPEGRAKRAARDAARVASGRNAERLRARRERLRSRTPEEIEADRRRLRPDGRKRCRSCSQALPFAEFYENANFEDGLGRSCRPCHIARVSGRLLRRALQRWEALDTWGCVYCGAEVEDVDHVIPRAHGGSDDPINLSPACATCNRGPGGKFDQQVVEWAVARWPELTEILDRLPWRWAEVVDG